MERILPELCFWQCVGVAATTVVVALGSMKIYAMWFRESTGKTKSSVPSAKESASAPCNKKSLATLEDRKPSNLWNTALFFPDFYADEPDSTTQQFLWYFQQARTSIRVCIYNFSFPELEYVLCKQYDRGLLIEFVVGQEATASNLRGKSIPCGVFPRNPSVPDTDQLMHHKFAVIDDEAVLVGSMNWTTEGILNNNENICVSTNPTHVATYLEEFRRLLTICKKAKDFY